MKISIITPTFNSAKTIEENVISILNQKYENVEHIIIDNLSKDRTLKKIRDLYKNKTFKKIKIISEKDRGISNAFNKGIGLATGEIIGILNSDDCFNHPNVLNEVAKNFENSEIDFVHGDILFLDSKFGTNIRRPLMCSLTYANPFNHPTMFLRRKVYNSVGKFKEDYKYSMDFEFICRMYKNQNECAFNGKYINGKPLVVMKAGGESDKYEFKSVLEVEKALKENRLWNLDSLINLTFKKSRIFFKLILGFFHLKKVTHYWRNNKWGKIKSI